MGNSSFPFLCCFELRLLGDELITCSKYVAWGYASFVLVNMKNGCQVIPINRKDLIKQMETAL